MDINDIIAKLHKLDEQSRELDIPEFERRQMMQEVQSFTDSFLSALPEQKVYSEKKPTSLAVSGTKHSIGSLLELYQKEVVETGIKAASGNFMGYIPGGGIYAAAMADFIAAVTNPYASVYYASPGAATVENEVINWLKTVFEFPEDAVGSLLSGGSISNLVALTAARDAHQIKNEKIKNSAVYLSEQVHHSLQKALRIIGLEDIKLRYVPMDSHHRLNAVVLAEMVEQDVQNGIYPFLLVGTAGTTDTGAVDPLNDLADIAQKHKMWFHVDAAYGGFFILGSRKHLFKGINRADSLIVDPHKGMFLPYGAGAVLIKDKASVLHSHYYTAHYMQDAVADELIQSPANISPELTKHFRGLRVWLPLQLHGIEPFKACLEEKLLLTEYFRIKLKELGFSVGPSPDLSVSYFWYPFEEDADTKNRQLMDIMHAKGDVYLSSSVIDNRFVIRIAILAFRTKKESVDRAIEMIASSLESIRV